jgi:hypothetical protein
MLPLDVKLVELSSEESDELVSVSLDSFNEDEGAPKVHPVSKKGKTTNKSFLFICNS